MKPTRRTLRSPGALVDEIRRGAVEGTPAFEAEVERDTALTVELHQAVQEKALLPFLAEHGDVGAEIVALALLRIAAIHIMAAWGMGPMDFAELARSVADETQGDAKAVRAKAEQMGQA